MFFRVLGALLFRLKKDLVSYKTKGQAVIVYKYLFASFILKEKLNNFISYAFVHDAFINQDSFPASHMFLNYSLLRGIFIFC